MSAGGTLYETRAFDALLHLKCKVRPEHCLFVRARRAVWLLISQGGRVPPDDVTRWPRPLQELSNDGAGICWLALIVGRAFCFFSGPAVRRAS